MEDSEVGEMWQIYKDEPHTSIYKLIRKLVEERGKGYKLCDMAVYRTKEDEFYYCRARLDFGISEAEWNSK